jgi:hypothetical protein
MDAIDRFIFDENVNRFADQLEVELHPDRRAQLQRLLIIEEDKYGLHEEQLEIASRRLREFEGRIAKQRITIGECDGDEEQLLAQAVLDNMLTTRNLFQQFYRRVSEVLRPKL